MAAELRRITLEEFCEYLEGLDWPQQEKFLRSASLTTDQDRCDVAGYPNNGWVRSHFENLDLSERSGLRKILCLFEDILFSLEVRRNISQLVHLREYLERDGFSYQDGQISDPSKPAEAEHLERISEEFNLPEVKVQVQRMLDALESDPCLAVGTAKELVETVGKTILDELQIPYESNWSLTQLLGKTREVLKLRRQDLPDSTRGTESVVRILGNLGSIVENMAHLRNEYGTGHGRSGRAIKGLGPRHARLASGAASVLCVFLWETHKERSGQVPVTAS